MDKTKLVAFVKWFVSLVWTSVNWSMPIDDWMPAVMDFAKLTSLVLGSIYTLYLIVEKAYQSARKLKRWRKSRKREPLDPPSNDRN